VNLKPAAGRVNVSVQLREPAQIQLSILRRDPSLKRDPARAYPLAGLALTTPRRSGLLPLTITITCPRGLRALDHARACRTGSAGRVAAL